MPPPLVPDPVAERVSLRVGRAHRAEFEQEVECGLHAPRVRLGEEREGGDVAEAEREHLKDDGREARAQDLGFGELGALLEILLGVEADRDSGCGATGAAGPLLRRRLRNGLDRQLLDLGASAVARDPGSAGVDHVADAGNRQAGLGDVRREDHAPSHARDGRPFEDAVLLGRAEAAVQGEDLGGGGILRVHAANGIRRIADLRLAGQEHQHVARRLAIELAQSRGDAVDFVTVVVRGALRPAALLGDGGFVGTAVADLDGIRATRHLDDRGRVARGIREVLREALRIDRRARDDHAQVGTHGEDLGEVPDQEIDVERSFVGLVDDDRVVATQQPVTVDLIEQDAVGHERDARVFLHLVGEAHLVAHGGAERDLELLGDALSDRAGGDAPRLGVRDARATELEADLRKLRRLARPGRAGHDHDLVVADRARDLVPRGADGQLRRKGDERFGRGHSLRSYRAGGGRRLTHPGDRRGHRAAVVAVACAWPVYSTSTDLLTAKTTLRYKVTVDRFLVADSERDELARSPRASLGPPLRLLVGRVMLVGAACTLIWMCIGLLGSWIPYPPAPLFAAVAMLPVNVICVVWVRRLLRAEGRSLQDLIRFSWRRLGVDILCGLLWVVLLSVPFALTVVGVMWLLHGEAMLGAFETVFFDPDSVLTLPPGVLAALAVIAVLTFAPLNAPAEELVYRGYGQQGLARRMPLAAAIVISAVLYGVQHAFYAPTADAVLVYVCAFFVWGVGSGVIAHRQGRLMPIIIAHGLVDLGTSAPALVILFLPQ